MLNSSLPEDSEQRLTDLDHTLDLMDFDGSDDLDINEFFEVFRILDAKDGKVDGILSLAEGKRGSNNGKNSEAKSSDRRQSESKIQIQESKMGDSKESKDEYEFKAPHK